MSIAIICDQVSKKYSLRTHNRDGYLWALRNISFEVHDGDRIGIIGLNGSGKTTLLKIIGGKIKPTAGKVYLSRQPVMLSSFDSLLHPDLSGVENIKLQFWLMGIKPFSFSRALEEILEFSELGRFIYEPVKMYSSGMMLRLSFSIMKIIKPEILLLDEVLSAGDLIFQKKADELMQMHFKASRAVIMASHNLHEIAQYCNRVIHLEKGETRNDGKVDELLQHYLISGIMHFDPENALEKQAVYINRKQLNTDTSVSVTDIALSSKENFEPATTIYINDFIFCRIAFRNSSGKKIKMSLDIHTLDGIWVMTTSPNLNECLQGFEEAEKVCIMQLPAMLLNAGIYVISLGFHNENNEIIQSFQKIIFFKISDPAFPSGSHHIIKGILRIPVKWTIR